MKPGPRPIPPETQRARGNPGRRRLPASEGVASKAELSCPEHLSGVAREVYLETCSRLKELRLLGAENGPLVERYAVSFARWRLAEQHLALEGEVCPAPKTGTPMPNPWLFIARAEADRCLRAEDFLGMTPASRGRVTPAPHTPDPDTDNPWARLRLLQQSGRPQPRLDSQS
jgi:P27 family predicted phage terminase small subunit